MSAFRSTADRPATARPGTIDLYQFRNVPAFGLLGLPEQNQQNENRQHHADKKVQPPSIHGADRSKTLGPEGHVDFISRTDRNVRLGKRTLTDDGTQPPLGNEVEITTCTACCPSGHASSRDPSRDHPSQDPSRDRPSQDSRRPNDSAAVPSGHASSVAVLARPSDY